MKFLSRQASVKQQAWQPVLEMVGWILERNNMDKEIKDRSVNPLIRIANALEEILRLVKEDQEKMRKIKEDNDFLDKQSNAEYYDEKN